MSPASPPAPGGRTGHRAQPLLPYTHHPRKTIPHSVLASAKCFLFRGPGAQPRPWQHSQSLCSARADILGHPNILGHPVSALVSASSLGLTPVHQALSHHQLNALPGSKLCPVFHSPPGPDFRTRTSLVSSGPGSVAAAPPQLALMDISGSACLSMTPCPIVLTGAPCPIPLDPASVYPS